MPGRRVQAPDGPGRLNTLVLTQPTQASNHGLLGHLRVLLVSKDSFNHGEGEAVWSASAGMGQSPEAVFE